jgi:serine protease AprX
MPRLSLTFFLLLSVLVAALADRDVKPARSAPSWQARVDSWVLETVATDGEAEFLVFLEAQADLSGAGAIREKAARGAYVVEQLQSTAARTQPAVVAELERMGVTYERFWIANMVLVRGDRTAVERLALRRDVAYLFANPRVALSLPAPDRGPLVAESVEPNITRIEAPTVWDLGITGEGVVIGGQDTGYQWDHPALKEQYRGWNGSTADHSYSWHDAIHGDINGGGNPCGFNLTVPCDDNSHGTHTMGTMVGDDGATNQIGAAPGARWIGCRNMEQGVGTPATYSECFQWFVAPTDLTGENPEPALAPDVINNSWTCPETEGCTDHSVLKTVVENTRAAGIVVVAAAGNYGPSCSTVKYPPAIYDASLTVGATDNSDAITSFSSRGPVTVDGSNGLKPEVTAPGLNVRSSVPYDGYSFKSGTSMAAPHVAGLVALLLEARPDLRGDVALIEATIKEGATPLASSEGCGGDTAITVPNNTYGYGRIDALATVEAARELILSKTAEPRFAYPGTVLTYTIAVNNPHLVFQESSVVVTETLPAQVVFNSASQPYMRNGQMITWPIGALEPGGASVVTVVVSIPESATGTLVNDQYLVSSELLPQRYGQPVVTPLLTESCYLPVVAAAP